MKTLPDNIAKDIETLLDYMHPIEEKHFDENGSPDTHIYHVIIRLYEFLSHN